MSEIKDDNELLEKVDLLTNLIEQMFLAHQIGDDKKMWTSHEEASKLGFDISNFIQTRSAQLPLERNSDTTPAHVHKWVDRNGILWCECGEHQL